MRYVFSREELVRQRKGNCILWIRTPLNFYFSILNDVVFNKKLSITDQAALLDAQQSLQQMIYDFLNEKSKKLSESEKRRLASQMNMSPISQEYATELR